MTEKQSWVWLTLAFGPANPAKWNVLTHYGSLEKCSEAVLSGDMSCILPKDQARVKAATVEKTDQLIELCDSKGIEIVTYEDERYPGLLREIYNPPAVLFCTGDIEGLNSLPLIATVGTRKPSEYSAYITRRIITELVSNGVGTVSGVAQGLDRLSHVSSIKAHGKSYAVLPCGHLYDYADDKTDVFRKVLNSYGGIISEYFPYDKPKPITFRARNRIISGISLGTLVLQAGIKSGSLSTASFALAQGRDIFCIPPHDIFDSQYSGVISLIRAGATPVFGAYDILESYRSAYPHIYRSDGEEEGKTSERPAPKKQRSAQKIRKSLEASPEARTVEPPKTPELEGIKKELYDFISSKGEVGLDDFSVGIEDSVELEAFLTELELDGLIKTLPGNKFGVT